MDYNKPTDVVANMIEAGRTKLGLSTRDLLVRGILAGAILATATTLAFGAAVSTGQSLVVSAISWAAACSPGLPSTSRTSRSPLPSRRRARRPSPPSDDSRNPLEGGASTTWITQ